MTARHDVALNPQQQRAVDHGAGPLMVLAGAGTGKTRVLVHRIARLVARGVPPWRILAVTFTNKAAGEMRERLLDMLGPDAGAMWIHTFHSACARLLRRHGDRVGVSPQFTIFDGDDQKRLLSALLKEHDKESSMTPRVLASRIDRAKNQGADPRTLPTGYGDDVVEALYPLYQAQLAREDAVDFNDLLLKVLDLGEDPEIGPVIAARFHHVLVDEFQDTNAIQYRLVRQLVRGTSNLTVVGDDDQSIYSWRGAEPRNLLEFDRDYPDAEVIKLEQNYRSTSVILGAANRVIARNVHRHGKALWTDREGGDPVMWEECDDERGEADFIARAMIGLVEQEGRSYGDFAVLYRTHAQSRVLEEQLRRYDVEYRVVGGVSFFQRKEIKDTLAYLRLIVNPAADTALQRIVNVPTRGIGAKTVERVRSYSHATGTSMIDAAHALSRGQVSAPAVSARIRGPSRKRLAEFLDMLDGLRDVDAAGASVSEVIIQVINRTGYREQLEKDRSPESQDRLNNLAELVSMASDYDEAMGEDATLTEFVERLSLSSANDERDGRGASVTLMTIHAAKGLEFPVVFLCGMEDGLFPSARAFEYDEMRRFDAIARAGQPAAYTPDPMEEERRLAYVAMTRAMERLVLTSARVRRHWQEVRANPPSRFLRDIPDEFLAVRERPPRRRSFGAGGWSEAPSAPGRSHGGGLRQRDDLDQRTDADRRGDDYGGVPAYDVDEPWQADDGPDWLAAGVGVTHTVFGHGRVIEIKGRGKSRTLLVDFPGVGLKTVLVRYVHPA